jgi:hypothetical protein
MKPTGWATVILIFNNLVLVSEWLKNGLNGVGAKNWNNSQKYRFISL